MKIVTYLSWLLRGLIFLALLLFALKNTDPVTLHLFLGETWQMPLILVLLAFFALGTALGVLACLARLLRQRLEIIGLKRGLRPKSPVDWTPPPPE
ncbi:MAG TPA: LapA family protein [Burkholderiales bacterium]